MSHIRNTNGFKIFFISFTDIYWKLIGIGNYEYYLSFCITFRATSLEQTNIYFLLTTLRKRKQGETTPGGIWAACCQFTLKLDQIWAETMDNGGLWQILVNVCQVWHRCHCQCQAWQQWQHSHSCHMLSNVVTCLLYINLTKKGW